MMGRCGLCMFRLYSGVLFAVAFFLLWLGPGLWGVGRIWGSCFFPLPSPPLPERAFRMEGVACCAFCFFAPRQ